MNESGPRPWIVAGAVLSALGASARCILPVVVAVAGAGSAALGARLEPFRPWLLGLTAVLLGFAFYQSYKPVECGPGEACAVPTSRSRSRTLLWIITALAIVLMTFPYYASWLF